MPEPLMKYWGRRYCCHWCLSEHGLAVPATLRVFAGVYGGGWAACAEHERAAVEVALRSMFKGRVVAEYKVDAFRVTVDEEGWPAMGDRLFSARRRDRVESRADR